MTVGRRAADSQSTRGWSVAVSDIDDALADAGAPGPQQAPASHVENLPARFLWLVDLLVIALAFAVAHAASPRVQMAMQQSDWIVGVLRRLGVPTSMAIGDFRPFDEMLGVLAILAPATLMSIDMLGGYRTLLRQSRTRVALTTLVAPVLGVSAFTFVLFVFRLERVSRTQLVLCVVLIAMGLLAYRMGLRAYKLARFAAGQYARGVLLVGTPEQVHWLATFFRKRVAAYAYRVVGCVLVTDGPERGVDPVVPLLGTVDTIGDLLVRRPIHDVVVVQPADGGDWLRRVVNQCDYLRVTLRLVSDALLSTPLRDLRPPPVVDGLPLPALVLRPAETDNPLLFIKRLFDIVVAATALVLLSPLFLLIAVAIKTTTPGLPVLYRWRVVGFKGREFVGHKFTTMIADADERKGGLSHLNEMTGPVFKMKNDPRVTPLGRFLRKYSLNELPQLWSVVKGDMSLVGPRPAFPHELGRYEYWQKRKLSVRPGITCLWQVSGRNSVTNFDDWVLLDLEYIENWSLWLDLKILARTVLAVLRGTGS